MTSPDTDDGQLPVKLYYRIGEVSEIVGVEPHVLRYWETEFRSIRPQKSRKGQRIYSRRDVDKLIKVKDLLYSHGFTIAGARKRLREGGAEPAAAVVAAAPPAPRPGAQLRAALGEIRRDIVTLLAELDSSSSGIEVAGLTQGATAG
ncbi:MAG TPA: MerR family transcriptional regulator [Polyangiaceae bacterium]|jgi:DNA-binding transcriptional MerR regulator|nr:MerR family transcriptional regulator [Polyangiaceae bacterium]